MEEKPMKSKSAIGALFHRYPWAQIPILFCGLAGLAAVVLVLYMIAARYELPFWADIALSLFCMGMGLIALLIIIYAFIWSGSLDDEDVP